MSKLIPLLEWSARNFDPPVPLRTLQAWARSNRFDPPPVKVGREYRVRDDAVYVPLAAPLTPVPPQADAVVAAIWNRTA